MPKYLVPVGDDNDRLAVIVSLAEGSLEGIDAALKGAARAVFSPKIVWTTTLPSVALTVEDWEFCQEGLVEYPERNADFKGVVITPCTACEKGVTVQNTLIPWSRLWS